jgi:ferredoxin
MARRQLQLRVDRILCDGYGMCAELLPELIDLDDWGYPMLRVAAIPRSLEDLAQRAVDVCPVLALRLHSVAGPTAVQPAAFRGAAARGT